ncbi:uncharacterized protein LOC143925621 [Lithobates pipiens]
MEDQLQIREEGRGAQAMAAQGDTMSGKKRLSVFQFAPETDVTNNPNTDVTNNPKTDVTKDAKTDVTKDAKTDVTKDAKTDVSQLLMLSSHPSLFQDVSLFYISQTEQNDRKTLVDRSSDIILYHSYSPETPLPELSDFKEFLDYCRGKHGSVNIKVVISDVEDRNSERKITEWWMMGVYRDWELLRPPKQK